MKKLMAISLIVLVAFLVGHFAFAAPAVTSAVGDVWGQGKFPQQPHKIFRLVRYIVTGDVADALPLTAESIVVWDIISDDGVTVTTTQFSPDSAVAGVLAVTAQTPEKNTSQWTAAASMGRRNWTWLQTYGLARVRINDTNAVSVGEAMGTSATAGSADIFVASTTDASKQGKAGFFMDDAAVTTTAECFLICD